LRGQNEVPNVKTGDTYKIIVFYRATGF